MKENNNISGFGLEIADFVIEATKIKAAEIAVNDNLKLKENKNETKEIKNQR